MPSQRLPGEACDNGSGARCCTPGLFDSAAPTRARTARAPDRQTSSAPTETSVMRALQTVVHWLECPASAQLRSRGPSAAGMPPATTPPGAVEAPAAGEAAAEQCSSFCCRLQQAIVAVQAAELLALPEGDKSEAAGGPLRPVRAQAVYSTLPGLILRSDWQLRRRHVRQEAQPALDML